MFGAITTKMNGMHHLLSYVTEYANTGPDGEGGRPIHMFKPFQNDRCMQCHSTRAAKYLERHGDDVAAIRSGETRCIEFALVMEAPVRTSSATLGTQRVGETLRVPVATDAMPQANTVIRRYRDLIDGRPGGA